MLKRASVICVMVLVGILFAFTNQSRAATLWCEDWEGNWTDNWHVDAGTWEVGFPTSGPGEPYGGQNCAATVLDGNYSNYVDTRLIRHTTFVVPAAEDNPRLRFYHWYDFRINDNDYGKVQIRVVGNENWETLDSYVNHSGWIWTRPLLSLSAYAGQTVEIAFYFHSDDGYVQPGWYIDDVCVETGSLVFNDPEDWESGFRHWYVDYGTWEVGVPTYGPNEPYEGNCVATRLDHNYSNYVDTRLISPPFVVSGENPRLRFYHWYDFRINDNDYGKVQIRVVGNENWETLDSYVNHSGWIWTRPLLSLSAYAGQTVEIAFYFHSDGGYVQPGWYIDDVTVETGDRFFYSPEDWESGFRHWYVDYGTWEVGVPTSGPGSAYSGEQCVATLLDSDYWNYTNTRLISPPFVVAGANPVLRFYHWYDFRINDDDYGKVQIRAVGNESWDDLEEYRNTSGGTWFEAYLPLSAYVGQTVEIAFYLHSDDGYVQPGWYIDYVDIGPTNQPPYEPSSPSPSNGATDVPLDTDLCWVGGDPDPEDTVTYDLYAGTSSPMPLIASDLTETCFDPGTLEECTTYYWKVVAEDNHGARTEGPEWNFTTICLVVPDIKANGSDAPLFVTPSENVNITVSLDPADMLGERCDWWIGMMSRFGTLWLKPGLGWKWSITPIPFGQYPLFDLSETSVFNTNLPVGYYLFFFILDDSPDGIFDMTWYDYVVVGVYSEALGRQTKNLADFDAIFQKKIKELMK